MTLGYILIGMQIGFAIAGLMFIRTCRRQARSLGEVRGETNHLHALFQLLDSGTDGKFESDRQAIRTIFSEISSSSDAIVKVIAENTALQARIQKLEHELFHGPYIRVLQCHKSLVLGWNGVPIGAPAEDIREPFIEPVRRLRRLIGRPKFDSTAHISLFSFDKTRMMGLTKCLEELEELAMPLPAEFVTARSEKSESTE